MLFPDVSKHFQIVVGVDAADLALDGDLEALLAYDLSLRGFLELLPHPVAVPFGVGQVAETDPHLGGHSVMSVTSYHLRMIILFRFLLSLVWLPQLKGFFVSLLKGIQPGQFKSHEYHDTRLNGIP